ncbi:MAG: DUF4249 domain-containing protein [Cytophagales bacterium]
MKNKFYYLVLVCLGVFSACNTRKDLNLELKDFSSQYAVECYLEDQKTYRLGLYKTVAIDDKKPLEPVKDAEVTIFWGSDSVRLLNTFVLDTNKYKAYNYFSPEMVNLDTSLVYFLKIKLPDGTSMTAQSRFLAAPKIVALQQQKGDKNSYSLQLKFKDISETDSNFYFVQIFEKSQKTDLDYKPKNANILSDRIKVDGYITYVTTTKYNVGEKLEVRLYHISKEHYNFISSYTAALSSVGNPFSKPTYIESNVSNALGIFACMNYTQDSLTIGNAKDTQNLVHR